VRASLADREGRDQVQRSSPSPFHRLCRREARHVSRPIVQIQRYRPRAGIGRKPRADETTDTCRVFAELAGARKAVVEKEDIFGLQNRQLRRIVTWSGRFQRGAGIKRRTSRGYARSAKGRRIEGLGRRGSDARGRSTTGERCAQDGKGGRARQPTFLRPSGDCGAPIRAHALL